jgi:hypothetical protein
MNRRDTRGPPLTRSIAMVAVMRYARTSVTSVACRRDSSEPSRKVVPSPSISLRMSRTLSSKGRACSYTVPSSRPSWASVSRLWIAVWLRDSLSNRIVLLAFWVRSRENSSRSRLSDLRTARAAKESTRETTRKIAGKVRNLVRRRYPMASGAAAT